MDDLFTGEGPSSSGTRGTSFEGKITSDEPDEGLVTWCSKHRYVCFTHFPDPSPACAEPAVATKLDPIKWLAEASRGHPLRQDTNPIQLHHTRVPGDH